MRRLGGYTVTRLGGYTVRRLGDDDDDTPVDVSKAVGTWVCVSSTDRSGGYSSDNLFVGQEVTIYDDGTYTSTSLSMGYTGTYEVSGSNVIVTTNSGRRFVIKLSFSGNRMTWNGSGEGVTFTYVFTKK